MLQRLEQAQRDLEKLAHTDPVVELNLDVASAMQVIGNLQLALRHPSNRGASAMAAARVVRLLAAKLGRTPAIRWLIEEGFRPDSEVPVVDTPPPASSSADRPT